MQKQFWNWALHIEKGLEVDQKTFKNQRNSLFKQLSLVIQEP